MQLFIPSSTLTRSLSQVSPFDSVSYVRDFSLLHLEVI